jgi:hypothetical protein
LKGGVCEVTGFDLREVVSCDSSRSRLQAEVDIHIPCPRLPSRETCIVRYACAPCLWRPRSYRPPPQRRGELRAEQSVNLTSSHPLHSWLSSPLTLAIGYQTRMKRVRLLSEVVMSRCSWRGERLREGEDCHYFHPDTAITTIGAHYLLLRTNTYRTRLYPVVGTNEFDACATEHQSTDSTRFRGLPVYANIHSG